MDTRVALEKARMLIDLGRSSAALPIIGKVLSAEPENAHAFYLGAHCHIRLGDFEEAEQGARKACALQPGRATYQLFLADVVRRRGSPFAAQSIAQQGLSIDPNNAEAHYTLAMIQCDLGDEFKAQRFLRKAITLDPEHHRALTLSASILGRLNDVTGADDAVRRALRIEPLHARSLSVKAWNDFVKGTRTEHRTAFRMALRQDPEDELARAGLLRAMTPLSFLQAWRERRAQARNALPLDPWSVLYPLSAALLMFCWLPVLNTQAHEPDLILLAPISWLILTGLLEKVLPDALLAFTMVMPRNRHLSAHREWWKLGSKNWILLPAIGLFIALLWNSSTVAVSWGGAIALYMIFDEAVAGEVKGWPALVRILVMCIWGYGLADYFETRDPARVWPLAMVEQAWPWLLLYTKDRSR